MKIKVKTLTILICIIILCFYYFSASAQTWENLGLNDEVITSIVFDPVDTNIIYAGANTADQGIAGVFKSIDGGASWDTLQPNFVVNKLIIHPQKPNIIYAGLHFYGYIGHAIMKSEDYGGSWYKADSGIVFNGEGILDLVMDPKHPDTLYAGVGSAYFQNFYDLQKPYKTVNGGKSWFPIEGGLEWTTIYSLAIDPDSTETVYAGSDSSNDVYKTTDGGMTWKSTGLRAFTKRLGYVTDIEIDPNNNQVLYACTFTNMAIFKSEDGGSTWQVMDNGFCLRVPRAIAIHPIYTNVVVVGSNGTEGLTNCIYYTTDGGKSWFPYNTTGLGPWEGSVIMITCLKFDPHNQDILYAATRRGIYRKCNFLQSISGIQEKLSGLTLFNKLHSYPNPFNANSIIIYSLEKQAAIELSIFDLLGRQIRTLIKGEKQPGEYQVLFDGRDGSGNRLPSGIYICRLKIGNYHLVQRIVCLR